MEGGAFDSEKGVEVATNFVKDPIPGNLADAIVAGVIADENGKKQSI